LQIARLMMKRILVVDDEIGIVDILKYNLEREGYQVIVAYDGKEAIDTAYREKPDLILLDVMLPIFDGFEVCRILREKIATPILMITAREEEIDAVLGLELGADDYIKKPFRMRELLSRVKANLRRTDYKSEEGIGVNGNIIEAGDLIIDTDKYSVTKSGNEISLTLREFELLKYLASRPGDVMTREILMEKVWEYEFYGDVRTVDVTIRRLRVKIEDDASNPMYIQIRRGVGYYFFKPE
jgi:two-component system, OmpR family, response regulator VicR